MQGTCPFRPWWSCPAIRAPPRSSTRGALPRRRVATARDAPRSSSSMTAQPMPASSASSRPSPRSSASASASPACARSLAAGVNPALEEALRRGPRRRHRRPDDRARPTGWLEALVDRRDTRREEPAAVVGGRTVFPNGLIDHAGLQFSLLRHAFVPSYPLRPRLPARGARAAPVPRRPGPRAHPPRRARAARPARRGPARPGARRLLPARVRRRARVRLRARRVRDLPRPHLGAGAHGRREARPHARSRSRSSPATKDGSPAGSPR